MPSNLHRYYGAGYPHFIATSCYQRRPLSGSPYNHDLFLEVIEQVRQRHRSLVVGYVVMPEHVHLLFSEPECGDPSRVMAALRASRTACCAGFAQAVEYASGRRSHLAAAFLRLRGFQREETSGEAALQHRRPVERGLVLEPQQWAWSSFRQYASDEAGSVLVNELRKPNSAYENRLMPAA